MAPSQSLGRSKRTAFTLIELLVVIAIIAILIGLLLPAVQKVREAANRMKCSNNLKQIALALMNYESAYHRFPPGGITRGVCCGTKSETNWAIEILPYLEQEALYKRYDQTKFNEDPDPNDLNNGFVRKQFVKTYICPSDLDTDQLDVPASGPAAASNPPLKYARGSYRAVSGRGAKNGEAFWDTCEPEYGPLLRNDRGLLHSIGCPQCPQGGPERIADVTDGTSNTLMLGEYTTINTIRRRTFWAYTYTSYNQSEVTPQSRILGNDYAKCASLPGPGNDDNPCKRGFGSMHANGLNFALCDGSVRFVSYNVDINLLAAMATIAGGEVADSN
jgi:prepilin-type N-terminal cleavage/methylation domain-containing protein/prepilin-type processing-associated H-X9-DG protein